MSTIRLTSLGRKLLLLTLVFTLLLGFFSWHQGYTTQLPSIFTSSYRHTCSPQDYAAGQWTQGRRFKALEPQNMTKQEDSLGFSGFTGCASSREFYWHLAADREEQYNRFPAAQTYDWTPGEKCTHMRPLDPAQLVKDLVEDGGWYLVGDSVTENHFFSLSCILHGHVIATPDYSKGGSWDRGWPQNLYLSPSSPMVSSISFPEGFDIEKTPLVTFRRIDILFSKEELVEIHRSIQPPGTDLEGNTLFSEEAVWTVPSAEYLEEFTAPLPQANYATMVVGTAGHWTVTLFNQTVPSGIEGVLNLFEQAMKVWLGKVETYVDEAQAKSAKTPSRVNASAKNMKRKRAVIRAYLPGHEDCHSHRKPWNEVQPFVWSWYNWGEIWRYNGIFEKLLTDRQSYPDIHYLGIDRPARLRPDAHTTGDCLHIMTGAGVLEGWTHYIWQYITREI
ncbi:hypothetical protein CPB83DRAFT_902945 [Crepidotus variabilis]|uniref:Uncharacterized protein n=1 Tax=Crepidotus variabilis TaxID=179855 RepID=A0A9P6JTX4_9AGAR|nr:hypothetical protein CPB83DRAFT_902945 [Crepidotus variabilis]